MEPKARELRELVEELKSKFLRAESELKNYENSCFHKSESVYDPIYTPAYIIPGDPPGTMGVDWRGPLDVPATTTDRWKRTCEKCGLVEYTTDTQEKIERIPKWENKKWKQQ